MGIAFPPPSRFTPVHPENAPVHPENAPVLLSKHLPSIIMFPFY